jgi:formiminoglutamase
VLYDCHSIRSVIPRLFDGQLPVFNLGTNDGKAADAGLTESVRAIMAESGRSWVVNGRFKGGWITRHFGDPQAGIHALQMELSNRGYMREAQGVVGQENWPRPYDPVFAGPMRARLRTILETALTFARG